MKGKTLKIKNMTITAISDTHGKHKSLVFKEKTETIIHSGDFTKNNSHKDVEDFLSWFGGLDFKYKILIGGNHDYFIVENRKDFNKMCKKYGVIYLEDEEIIIEGIKFYGSPWTPECGNYEFMLPDKQLASKWLQIPLDTDVLITHGPAHLILDDSYNRYLGSVTLRERIKTIIIIGKENGHELLAHVFGHIHEGYGLEIYEDIVCVNGALWFKHEIYTFEIFKEIPEEGDFLSITSISDTHGKHDEVKFDTITDIIVHTGDFSKEKVTENYLQEMKDFLKWFGELNFKHKILIGGNHDYCIVHDNKIFLELCEQYNITYLEDSSCIIDGIKFYGTPWSEEEKDCDKCKDFVFVKEKDDLQYMWFMIEDDTKVLLTHIPPMNILDTAFDGVYEGSIGSVSLLKRIEDINYFGRKRDTKITIHSFGHSHQGSGIKKYKDIEFINGSVFFDDKPIISKILKT